MVLFKNLVALAVAFIVGVIAVTVLEWAGQFIWPPPEIGEGTATIVAKAIAAFIGGSIVVLVAESAHMWLALLFGAIVTASEIIVLYTTTEPTLEMVAFKLIYLAAAYLGAQIGISFFNGDDPVEGAS